MRKLTIKRTKSFVGCAAKIKIYIEDPASNEITIACNDGNTKNNVPCRKIGELKNGEEKTFEIDECAAKVFVIADNLSKDYCNEYYQLTEGQEDIFLCGKNELNPASGNAFRFDNNQSEGIAENRKQGKRKGLVILIAAIIAGAIFGFVVTSGLFSDSLAEEKAFSSGGITIILTDEFKKVNVENYTVAYESKNIAVFALKEELSLAEGFEKYTLKEYADLVIKASNVSAKAKTTDGLTHFEYKYTNPQTKDVYKYFSYVYKTDDAFWVVQFATLSENADTYAQQITDWAKAIKFSK